MKLSSRSGRFKKKIISKDHLQEIVPEFIRLLNYSLDNYNKNLLTAHELAAHYILLGLAVIYPGTWAGAFQKNGLNLEHRLNSTLPDYFPLEPNIKKRLHNYSIGDILNNFAFRSTPISVNRALLLFSLGHYPLEVMFHIPSPKDVLKQQKDGRRCLTLITREAQLKNYILNERDFLSFAMHDLIHADHFYHSNLSYQGQLGLYNLLFKEINLGSFDELLKNPEFQDEFEYVIADMNAYPIHLLKCLKSAVTFYGGNKMFNSWANRFSCSPSLIRLNTKEYSDLEEDPILLRWLLSYTRE